ncbi:Histone-Lysine N-Methyltransferase ash1l [Irineochytrium annulatum]|nr:Histone-Lysine N-Methyltransferase ash1l [Irineochytrium annulatum]
MNSTPAAAFQRQLTAAIGRMGAIPSLDSNKPGEGGGVSTRQPARASVHMDSGPTPDEIRCICTIREEFGDMIYCEECQKWQHMGCLNVDPADYPDGVPYLCEECDPNNHPYYKDRKSASRLSPFTRSRQGSTGCPTLLGR